MKDLGTLGGPDCPGCNSGADGPNLSGEAAVGSETSKLDPNGEDFCEFGTHHQCLGAIWKDNVLKALPTLPGANNDNAFNLNDEGLVVGFSENGIRDSCLNNGSSPIFRFEAVLWEPNGKIRELHPLPGDTVGFALGINDGGQVVGASGLCSNTAIPPSPAGAHAVLWEEDGSPTDLGSLGGKINAASSINNRGEVDGASQSSKDGNIHAFLWTRDTGMRDLGILPGAVVTVAACCNTINDEGQVVGFSIDGTTGNSSAFFWEKGVMYDLNTLIPKGSPWNLQQALSINDAGEIVGSGLIDGNVHAFLATPCDRNHGDAACCRDREGAGVEADEGTGKPQPVLSESARKLLQQLTRRYPISRPQ